MEAIGMDGERVRFLEHMELKQVTTVSQVVSVDELHCCTIAFFAYANFSHIDLSPLSASEMFNMHKKPSFLE